MSEVTIVRFDGDNLQAVREDGQVWVVVKRVCEALGIAEQRQAEKLKTKPWAVTTLTVATGQDGRNYEMFCLDLDSLPMWLATIEVSRVRPEAREKLIAYQRECARVLRDHFFGSRTPVGDVNAAALNIIVSRLGLIESRLSCVEMGMISVEQYRHLQSEVKSVALLEKVTGRHRNTRAASADIYREMGRAAGWGSKGQPWNRLPTPLLQPALAVISGRRRDSERAARNLRQLSLVHSG